MQKVKISYLPNIENLFHPGDRRRFVAYSKIKNLEFNLFDYKTPCDILVASQQLDISQLNLIKKKCKVLIYDAVDSYHQDSSSFNARLRGLAKYISRQNRFLLMNYSAFLRESFLPYADIILCASKEQQQELKKYNQNVFSVYDMLEEQSIIKTDYEIKNKINLVWEGLGSNLFQLSVLKVPLSNLAKKYNITLNIVTDKKFKKYLNKFIDVDSYKIVADFHNDIKILPWTKENFIKNVIRSDIAIIPIDLKNNLSIGKPENKLIHLWKMGMPVLTSPSKSYSRVMNAAGVDGLCETSRDWQKKIEALILSRDKRFLNASKGRLYAENRYSREIFQSEWDKVFLKAETLLENS